MKLSRHRQEVTTGDLELIHESSVTKKFFGILAYSVASAAIVELSVLLNVLVDGGEQ